MSFRTNPSNQISMIDSLWGLTPREQKALENSWAKVFAEDVFPNIDEQRFAVLYSDKDSRPNTPVNILVGSMILKELFDLSDDEMVETLMLDLRFQYALHTTSFKEQPLSDKSLTRFRRRCYDYETTHGVDLYKDCVTDLSASLAKLMKIDGRIRRMDSTMIEANIRKLSRMELLYTCIAKLVRYLAKNAQHIDLEGLEHYNDPNDYNRVIYHSRSKEVDERMLTLLNDADKLFELCGAAFDEVIEYQLFVRCISEQTIVEDSVRRLKTKEDGGMDSSLMQNPSDPEATYRTKAGKAHRGYIANVEESVGENGSIITSYDVRTNNTSDCEMLQDHLQNMDTQEETVSMTVDGAYASVENIELAVSKNVELIPTDLTGQETDPIMGKFELTEDGTKVLKCPAGHKPKSCSFDKRTRQCHVSFLREHCIDCPFKDQCKPKVYKRVAKKTVSRKSIVRAQVREKMQTEQYKLMARIRNGVETIPSLLKNQYHANEMPVHGLQRTKFFIGSKIGAINFQKIFRFRKGTGNYAQNPVFC